MQRSRWLLAAVVVAVVVGLVCLVVFGPGVVSQRADHPPFDPGVRSSLGVSVQHRPIELTTFGDGTRRILVLGGVHGDEYGSAVADAFVAAVRADPALIPEGATIDVIACLNPDGLAAGTKGNANNADINRNMPTPDWRAKLDPKDLSGQRGLNGGTSSASEPETQALLQALKTHYSVVVSLHSKGGIVDFDGPGAESLARVLAESAGLPLDHVAYQTYIHGSLGGYLKRTGTPLITVELPAPALTDGLRAGILALAKPQ